MRLSTLSYLFIFPILYLYQNGFIDIYFILGVIIQYYLICFVAQNVPTLATGRSFSGLLYPFDMPLLLWFLWAIPYFLSTTNFFRIVLYLSYSSLEAAISLRNHSSFYWRTLLETKVWALRVIVAAGVTLLLGLSPNRGRQNMCLYYTRYIYIYITIPISIHL